MCKKIFEKEFEETLKEQFYGEYMGNGITKDFFENGEFLREIFERKEELSIVFAGDSITHGPLHTNGYRSYSEYFKEIVRRNRKDGKVNKIRNTGVSGATTEDIMANFDSWIKIYEPEFVFLMIGMNDSAFEKVSLEKYEENLKYLVNKIREIGAVPILQTSNTIQFDESRDCLNKYMNIIRKLSEIENVFIIDQYDKWVELESKDGDIRKKLLNDSIHPNEIGHLEFIKHILKVFNHEDINLDYDFDLKFKLNEIENKNIRESNYFENQSKEFFDLSINNIRKNEGTWLILGSKIEEVNNLPINFKSYVEYIEERVRWELSSDIERGRERYMIDFTSEDFSIVSITNNIERLINKYNCNVVLLNIDLDKNNENLNEHLEILLEKINKLGVVPIINLIYFNNDKEEINFKINIKENKCILINTYEFLEKRFLLKDINEILFNNKRINSFGHLEIARVILERLNIWNNDSVLGKLYRS